MAEMECGMLQTFGKDKYGNTIAGVLLPDGTNVVAVSPGVPVHWLNSMASPHSIRHDGCLTDWSCAYSPVVVLRRIAS
jgi:hypothetical protein